MSHSLYAYLLFTTHICFPIILLKRASAQFQLCRHFLVGQVAFAAQYGKVPNRQILNPDQHTVKTSHDTVYPVADFIETLPMPREALREALLNACINKDYAEPSSIQIRVYENKLEIINGGVLPEGWTVETLLSSHRSMPYNPDIANTFFRAGEIEAWGRGIERIITACKNDGFSTPKFRYDASGIWTTFKFEYTERATTQYDPIRPRNDPETDQQKQENVILELIKENPYIQRKELVSRLGIHESSVKRRLVSLQEKGMIKHVGPNKGGLFWIY